MAYTLTDQFRPLRMVMRLNGVVVGLALGLVLLLTPKANLAGWGLYVGGSLWPFRATGCLLFAFGLLFVLGANQDVMNLPMLLSMVVSNSLLALILLLAYFQQELAGLTRLGQFIFVFIFLLCLVGAVVPLRYFRVEYRPF